MDEEIIDPEEPDVPVEPTEPELPEEPKEITILDSIKNYLGISEFDTAFDQEVLLHVNMAFSTLYEIGVGIDFPYRVSTKDETWTGLFSDYLDCVDLIKEYAYLRVKILFDPPSNSFVLDSLEKTLKEAEYRIQIWLEGFFKEENND